jgi:hypothetical protein
VTTKRCGVSKKARLENVSRAEAAEPQGDSAPHAPQHVFSLSLLTSQDLVPGYFMNSRSPRSIPLFSAPFALQYDLLRDTFPSLTWPFNSRFQSQTPPINNYSMPAFEVPEELNDESWSTDLAPLFPPTAESAPPYWYTKTNETVQKTLLALAIEGGSAQAIEVLLKHAPLDNLKFGHDSHDNLIYLAILNLKASDGGQAVLKYLLQYPDFVRKQAFAKFDDLNNQTAIHLAASSGVNEVFTVLESSDREELVKLLKDCKDDYDNSPLDLAIEYGQVSTFKILLNLTSISEPEVPQENILHRAVKVKSPQRNIIETILQRYPDLVIQHNQDAQNPLQYLDGKQENKNVMKIEQRVDPSSSLKEATSPESSMGIDELKYTLMSCLFEKDFSWARFRKELGAKGTNIIAFFLIYELTFTESGM